MIPLISTSEFWEVALDIEISEQFIFKNILMLKKENLHILVVFLFDWLVFVNFEGYVSIP